MHTKRIAVGYGKKDKWIVTPNPGPHPKDRSIPLLLIVRDILKYADTAREGKAIIHKGLISVDKKVRKDPKFGVGLMDIVEIPKLKKCYRVLPNKKGFRNLKLKEINPKESNLKLCKILNKRIIDKETMQLNLHDGSNILIKKEDSDKFKTKDTIVLELPKKNIKKVLNFKKGNTAIITKGRHSGELGKISEITESTQTRKSITKINGIQTLTDYVFIVGDEKKPIITI